MSGYAPVRAAFAVAVAVLAWPAAVYAVPVSSALTAVTGEGSFDDTIGCPAGDGPSWRYQFTGPAAALNGPLGGTWSGTAEIHDAKAGRTTGAFVQPQTGRIRITTADRGSADFAFGAGSCANAPLTLSTDAHGDPVVSGAVALSSAGGTGALRGLTGSGTAAITGLGVGPGADNTADLKLNANLQALAPALTVGDPQAAYIGIVDWATGTATVRIPISDPGPAATTGDAFDVKVTAASVSPQGQLLGPPVTLTVGVAGPVTGPPISLGRIDNGADPAYATVQIANTFAGAKYTLTTTVKGNDALDSPVPAVTQTRTFTTPVLPQALLLPAAPIV